MLVVLLLGTTNDMQMSTMINSIGRMFDGLSAGTGIGKVAVCLGTAITAFYSPIALLLLTCFAFSVTDMVYGIKVAVKNKQKILSNKGWRGTLRKLMDEWTIISLARLLEFAVLGDQGVFVLTGGATVIIALTELWSILENLNTLNPDGPWKSLGKFLKKKGEEHIGIEIDLKDENTSSAASSSENGD